MKIKRMYFPFLFFLSFFILSRVVTVQAQPFYFGADLSYVNEMEDCGAVFYENSAEKDPFQIFADHRCNLVRLRLWHTPAWYDNLNNGYRYSDFQDVKRSIQRAKAYNMSVLLDFHLSDNWADPGKQRVPDAWLLPEFIDHGVTDFDIMGISYYWQWHKPTTIPQTGAIIAQLIANHPGYEVMILETGTIWTTLTNDNAGNVLNEVNPAYSPASPEYQKKWLVDLTQEVINKGGSGVVYWEPAWVSTGCSTQWGVGSHYENATFFDFDNNLLPAGGIGFMQHDYENLSAESGDIQDSGVDVLLDSSQRRLMVIFSEGVREGLYPASIVNQVGKEVFTSQIEKKGNGSSTYTLDIPALSIGIYVVVVWQGNTILERKKILFN